MPSGRGRPGHSSRVVGPDDRTNELLHQVVLFICAPRRGDACDCIRAPLRSNLPETLHHRVIGLIPGDLLKSPIASYQGAAQPIRMVIKSKGVASLQAGVGVVDLGINGAWIDFTSLFFVATSRLHPTPQ